MHGSETRVCKNEEQCCAVVVYPTLNVTERKVKNFLRPLALERMVPTRRPPPKSSKFTSWDAKRSPIGVGELMIVVASSWS